jgi:hypothetical protein
MMLLWVSPTPLRKRAGKSAAGNPLPRTMPARSQVPTKISGSRYTPDILRDRRPEAASQTL